MCHYTQPIGMFYGGTVHVIYKETIDDQLKLDQLIKLGGSGYVNTVLKYDISAPTDDGLKVGNAIKNLTIEIYDQLRKDILDRQDDIKKSQAVLNAALESRKQKETKVKEAENKLNEEKKKPRKGTKNYGHEYHPAPKTEDIKGVGELKKGTPGTPLQGGGGLRKRWIGDKGRKVYEWDSSHGELEGYQASDGKHLGAFDFKTGKQLKPAEPKRNIKRYL